MLSVRLKPLTFLSVFKLPSSSLNKILGQCYYLLYFYKFSQAEGVQISEGNALFNCTVYHRDYISSVADELMYK